MQQWRARIYIVNDRNKHDDICPSTFDMNTIYPWTVIINLMDFSSTSIKIILSAVIMGNLRVVYFLFKML